MGAREATSEWGRHPASPAANPRVFGRHEPDGSGGHGPAPAYRRVSDTPHTGGAPTAPRPPRNTCAGSALPPRDAATRRPVPHAQIRFLCSGWPAVRGGVSRTCRRARPGSVCAIRGCGLRFGAMTGHGRLLLVRHARTAGNVGRRRMGREDVPLDHVGRQQADGLASTLQTVIPTHAPAAIHSSPLLRATQTIAPFAAARNLRHRGRGGALPDQPAACRGGRGKGLRDRRPDERGSSPPTRPSSRWRCRPTGASKARSRCGRRQRCLRRNSITVADQAARIAALLE
jgi:hypothetical protein